MSKKRTLYKNNEEIANTESSNIITAIPSMGKQLNTLYSNSIIMAAGENSENKTSAITIDNDCFVRFSFNVMYPSINASYCTVRVYINNESIHRYSLNTKSDTSFVYTYNHFCRKGDIIQASIQNGSINVDGLALFKYEAIYKFTDNVVIQSAAKHCYASRNTTNLLVTNTTLKTVIPLTVSSNSPYNWVSNNSIIVPVTGFYLIDYYVSVEGDSGNVARYTNVDVNDADIIYSLNVQTFSSSSAWSSHSWSGVRRLNVNDKLGLRAWTTTGGTMNVRHGRLYVTLL
jgi:hypothetical protein